jgi:predicted HicB family RNase H-like nuclease
MKREPVTHLGEWPGIEITPELVAELAAEAECGFERVPRARYVGKPVREYDENTARIVFRVPPKVRIAAQKRADLEGIALNELAAEALRERLKRKPTAPADS